MSETSASQSLLGEKFIESWIALDELVPQLNGYRYEFVSLAEFEAMLSARMTDAMAVYWQEILYRSHWAAATSLIRTHRWLSGMFDAYTKENLIVFCACSRGLLEASADSWDGLSSVAPTLASCRSTIDLALRNQLDKNCIAENLENQLIHFTHGRKPPKGETVPDQHKAKTIAAYLQHLEEEVPSIYKYYGMLSDVVHPGASSILSFMRPDSSGTQLTLEFEAEKKALHQFADAFRLVVSDVMATGFNASLITLRTLNRMPAKNVHTPYVESLAFNEASPGWRKIEDLLKK